jgi:hypothetical protein
MPDAASGERGHGTATLDAVINRNIFLPLPPIEFIVSSANRSQHLITVWNMFGLKYVTGSGEGLLQSFDDISRRSPLRELRFRFVRAIPRYRTHRSFSCTIKTSLRYLIHIMDSNTRALAPPPPLQIPTQPIFPFFALRTPSSVVTILAPLAPNG